MGEETTIENLKILSDLLDEKHNEKLLSLDDKNDQKMEANQRQVEMQQPEGLNDAS